MKTVESWYEPTDEIRKKKNFICEMSRADHGLLCGLLRKYKPQKILEIGVAEGGTTSLIISVLASLGLKSEFFSVDLNEYFYLNKTQKTGYVYEQLQADFSNHFKGNHHFLFGKTIAGQLDKIGGEIDFVIIDTTTELPGEVLDFLAVLPYLKKNAIVVLHDVWLHYFRSLDSDLTLAQKCVRYISTKLLLTSVVAEKFIDVSYDNIAAFQITADTYKYITDVFYSLTMPWSYWLDKWMEMEYRKIFEIYYSKEQIEIFNMAIKRNMQSLEKHYLQKKGIDKFFPIRYMFPYGSIPKGSKIAIYGGGNAGQDIFKLLQKTQYCTIEIWVDQRFEELAEHCEIYDPQKIKDAQFDYVLVSVVSDNVFNEIRNDLINIYGIDEKKIIGPLDQY